MSKSSKNTLAIVALAGAAFWAYRLGYLDQFVDPVREAWTDATGADGSGLAAQNAGSFTPLVPAVTEVDPVTRNAPSLEESLLWRYNGDVQPWAKRNRLWVAAMMWQESRGNPDAVSSAGAMGLMQVMPGTMRDLHRWGWRKYDAEPALLHLPNVGIYFGTAYLEYLTRRGRDREWMTKAYNAGPGGGDDGSWPAETVDYLARITAHFNEISAAGGMA